MTITFKCPDAVDTTLEEHHSDLQYDEVKEEKKQIREILKKWIRHGEYVSITFDLVKMTAMVNDA